MFWDQHTNPAPVDLDDPLINVFNGKERVMGLELGAVGKITDKWQVLVNYTCAGRQDHRGQRSDVSSAIPC